MTDRTVRSLQRRAFVRGWGAAMAGAGVCALAGLPSVARALQAAAASTGAPKHPIFVLNSQDANVSVIDPTTWAERQRIPTGKEPHHLYLTPDEKSVIVANAASNSLTFIDPATAQVQRTIPAIADPYHLRFSPDMKWFVTAANRLHHIDIYRWTPSAAQPLALAKRIEAPRTPSHLAIDTRSSVVYASLQDSNELIAIDLATQAVRWKVSTGKMPADVFLTRDDKHLLVGLTADKVVEVYDVSGAAPRLVKRLETGNGAHAFRSRGDGRHVFVSNRVANSISMIDLTDFTVAAQLPGPGGPDCMEMMSDNKTLLLSSRWAGQMTVIDIDTRKAVRQVKVGRSPHGIWTLDHARRD
ncbi:MAG: YncE family protein [Rubrivivax sp.]|jgi:YVTN family beta-propeller protein|nr:YncE family protein [Rubrivivax sp.]